VSRWRRQLKRRRRLAREARERRRARFVRYVLGGGFRRDWDSKMAEVIADDARPNPAFQRLWKGQAAGESYVVPIRTVGRGS
jgi:hypothetical protein